MKTIKEVKKRLDIYKELLNATIKAHEFIPYKEERKLMEIERLHSIIDILQWVIK